MDGIDSRTAASKLVGRNVVWKTSSGKKIAGKIAGPHGNNGVVRARFSKGISGEAIGTDTEIKE